MESAAVKSEGLVIPLIDFSNFLNGNPEQRKTTAKAILHGFQTAGFIYLKGLPFSPEYRKHVFANSAELFKLSEEEKMKGVWTTPEANRGYSAPGREKVSLIEEEGDVTKLRSAAPDLKESWEIGREGEEGHPNHWPEEKGNLVGFKDVMLKFFDECKGLHTEVMRAIAVGLEIEETWFDGFTDVGDNTLRLLHYPEVDRNVFQVNPGQVRAGAHSDYGSITLLFQDARGGLQVQSPNGTFVDATPMENTCVVNAGDLLARWSNDTIKSTVHRVVEPPAAEGDSYPARYSIAYFCNPNYHRMIEAIPGTYASPDELKYKAISSGDYLVQRLAATY